MSKRRHRYTPEDDARLRGLWANGTSRAEIAAIMGLTEASIKQRKEHLKLPNRNIIGATGFEPKAGINHSIEWREHVAQREAELKRAMAHAQRVSVLPALCENEAAALVAAALAAGKVTRCPPRFVAPITGAPA